jgi:Cu2+-exporting ATPase
MPRGERRSVLVSGEQHPVCCAGCEAVATLIHSSGLDGYYKIRDMPAPRPDSPDSGPDEWDAFDRVQVQENFLRTLDDGACEAAIAIQNINCPACAWLIEHSLNRIDGVEEITVNPASGRALLRFQPDRAPLSQLMRTIARLGYKPHPTGAGESAAVEERRTALKRLAVAGFGMMQVSTFAVSVWFGAFQGIDPVYRDFLNAVSWLVATPVLLYSGRPFFQGALRDLQARRVGMDVPVALGMAIAYIASIWNALIGSDRVYFDSVTMFVFFLLIGRYVEMAARHKAAHPTDALAQLIPPTARRLHDNVETRVAVAELLPGDIVAVAQGEAVPADGVVVWGDARLDESMLTGESEPQRRSLGATVIAGSINVSHPFQLRVERLGQDTVLSTIGRLLDRAQAQRPRLAHAADWIAGHFVVAVLFVAVGVFAFWWPSDPELALQAMLAVLVVSCPCALGLATPSALVAGTDRLAQDGLLVARADALETLAKVTHVVFDKTGTLTTGAIIIDRVVMLSDADEDSARQLASALERHSLHPIARAFTDIDTSFQAEAVESHPGGGLEGRIDGRLLRLGTPDFVAAISDTAPIVPPADSASWIALGDEQGAFALFRLIDRIRPEAEATIGKLRRMGLCIEIASGDQAEPVQAVAERLGIDHYAARLTPADKLDRIRSLQAEGAIVAVVGDGVNDAPVLAGADVSIALGSGTALAQTSAAMILLGDSLRPVANGIVIARRTSRVIRQNLGWALLYNILALPLAAGGWLHPWMAALGMSLSSLIVVLNAMQLNRRPRKAADIPTSQPLTSEGHY